MEEFNCSTEFSNKCQNKLGKITQNFIGDSRICVSILEGFIQNTNGVHRHSTNLFYLKLLINIRIQQDARMYQNLFHIYMKLNMFR
jgi:hypothetical protein